MNERILVVDDEQSMLEFLEVLLEEEGYQVTTARSVSEGRQCWSESDFALVLCDLMMPDGSGLELLEDMPDPIQLWLYYANDGTLVDAVPDGIID